jgi:5-hydroxyisourate hydrolase-like protein (transthyretin family)
MPEFTIVLGNTVTLPGRVVFEGLDQSGVERILVQLRSTSGFGTFITGIAGGDGTFQIENTPPGEYRVGIAPSGDYFIKEGRFDRNDVLTQPLKFSGTLSGGAGLEIVLSRNVGQVSGLVTDEKLQPVAGVQVVLVPEKNRDRTELFKSVTTDESGRFLLAGITPGDYRLYSWESLETYGYFDPQVLKDAEPFGKLFHVAESSKHQLDVRIIPASR